MEVNTLFSLQNKVILVTGSSGGLGSAIVSAMQAHGAKVIASDLNNHNKPQSGVDFIPCDLSRNEDIDQLVERAKALHGRIDVLVSNAGIQGPAGPIGGATDDDWDAVMSINLKSALRLCSALLPDMAERGQGSVILMSSIAGVRGNKAIGLYGLSKAGLAQLARNLAVEWGPKGIRVNCISPGLIRTPLATELLENAPFMERRLSLTPLRRVGEPEEIAGVAVMLASKAGGFISGQNIVVDGGTTISDGS
ncbi:SDR family NAD(P)-dependent oxidoreductase [Marinomonas transparens]|uniref:SDR family oxidoreductase n=1 Tax=Marinomonas transparens TaxID=2795388 RepID=A0A934JRB9_9GAMM|nr:SDR family oxidoreductase [Marinomonas transparens]MBJ7538634.1 SDR family oxidoreductase [Marinomonas transparens]